MHQQGDAAMQVAAFALGLVLELVELLHVLECLILKYVLLQGMALELENDFSFCMEKMHNMACKMLLFLDVFPLSYFLLLNFL